MSYLEPPARQLLGPVVGHHGGMTRSTRRGDDLESWVILVPRASVRTTAVFGEWPSANGGRMGCS